MRPVIPIDLLDRAAEWDELHRWERSELGKDLRRLGLTYGEIREVIPVPKGTLSYWCRDIRLSSEQVEGIRERTGPGARVGIPVDTQWRRRLVVERIQREAKLDVERLVTDPRWVAGTVMYWAEGSKTNQALVMANTDPEALRVFTSWARRYHNPDAKFTLSLHLHEGNDERAAQAHWTNELRLPEAAWGKTFIKPKGTGHRKNRLSWGVCRVYVHRSADAFERTLAWIEGLDGRLS